MKTSPQKIFVLLFLLFVIIVCSFSCTPQKRLNRLIRKHPELLQKDTIFLSDTTKIVDTTFIKEVKGDTTVHISALEDTLTMVRDNIRFEVIRVHDSIYIRVHKPADTLIKTITVIKKIKVPYQFVVYKDIPWRLAWYWVVIAFVCGLAITLAFINKRRNSKDATP